MRVPHISVSRFLKRLFALFRQRFFWFLTFAGNLIIFMGALIVYKLEAVSPNPPAFVDCLLLSAGLVTTVGYSSFMVVTVPAKIAVFAFMLIGTLFVWIYMAFLVTGLIAPELANLEHEVHDVERELKHIQNPSKPGSG